MKEKQEELNPNEVKKRHPGGRPRTYDREWLRDELAKWSLKPESIVLTQFCDEYSIASTKVQDFAREDIEFRMTLRIARDRLQSRREQYHNKGTITPTSYNRYVKHYDGFLKTDEREDIDYENKSRAQAISQEMSTQDEQIKQTLEKAKYNGKMIEEYFRLKRTYEPETGIEHISGN